MKEFTIRDYRETDIKVQNEYFEKASDEYLLNLGVEPTKIRGIPADFERVRASLALPIQDRVFQNYAIDVEGNIVGVAILKKIIYGEVAELHGHIFNIENRRVGIATEAFLEILKNCFETFKLKKIICEPTSTNPAPNALLQKMGLQIIATYKTPAEGILRERMANRYEITQEYYKELSKRP